MPSKQVNGGGGRGAMGRPAATGRSVKLQVDTMKSRVAKSGATPGKIRGKVSTGSGGAVTSAPSGGVKYSNKINRELVKQGKIDEKFSSTKNSTVKKSSTNSPRKMVVKKNAFSKKRGK